MKAKNHIGKIVGKLVVIDRAYPNERRGRRTDARWLCRCECGNDKVLLEKQIVEENIKSCGCGQYKLNPAKRDELLKLYLAQGYEAAKPLAESYGIQARYLARLARRNGYHNNYVRKDRVKVKKSSPQDPRWNWAIERGSVIV